MKRKERLIGDLELVLSSEQQPPQTEKTLKEVIAFLKEHRCMRMDSFMGRLILGHLAKELLSEFIE